MSNSSRIEAATRQHVGATLTAAQIAELVKLSDPTSSKGVYPSDCAYKRDQSGKLVPRGKTAYGDGVLEYVGENNFKVLPTDQIVRRKPLVVKKDAAPVTPAPTPAAKAATGNKKAAKSSSQPPSATKSKANLARQVQ
ncbi:MAG: hypothetical protein ACJ713_09865 [Candidatus Sulfotelmatobacter sp.]